MRSVLAPRLWGVHVLAAAAVAVAGLLGLWQWHAWEQRRADEARDLTEAAAMPLADAIGPDDPFPGRLVGQPVTLRGDWVPSGTVYVANREAGDRLGVWAVTPLEVDGAGGSALLVVRGWAPDPASAPAPPQGRAELVGWLQPPEGTGEVDEDPTDDVLPQLRIADAIQHVDQDLYGAYAIATDRPAVNAGTAGLEPTTPDQVPPVGRFTAVRNLFYAIQWWIFGGFALFVWARHVADQLAPPPEEDPEEDPEEAPGARPEGEARDQAADARLGTSG